MIAVDTNVLVYAHRRDSEWHAPARRAVELLAEDPRPWAIPWPCLYEFQSIATHPRIYRPPTEPAAAIAQLEAWLESPSLRLLSEAASHGAGLLALLREASVRGPKVHDARIAALCVQAGVDELWTADRDFSRFPALKTRNPLLDG